MKDSDIKGTGNSRYLKSSLEGITTWEQFRNALAAGTLPVDLNGINPDGFQQLGDPLNKATLLKDATASLLGLGTSAVPDDAFLVLALGSGYYGYRVKVQLADGTPVEGATLTGISALPGSSLVTGADGIVVGRSSSASVTIGCTSPYIDQKAPAAQTVTKTGTITDVTLTLSNNTEIQTINSSKTARISPLAKTLDITAVGGGGGGGGRLDWKAVSNYRISYTASGGGGGGYAETVTAHPLSNNKKIDITVGSGGSPGDYVYSESAPGLYGGTGGTTVVKIDNTVICTANGGKGGRGGKSQSDIPLGGDGNGAGGRGGYGERNYDGGPGVAGSKYIFDDQSLGLAGGGGGGGGNSSGYNTENVGGAPNGGNGYRSGDGSIPAEAGAAMGGGGGGGSAQNSSTYNSKSGGAGGAYLRFHF